MANPPDNTDDVPVITIDGPSGAGKGTASMLLAKKLRYHLLDSGAVYRAAAVHALNSIKDLDSEDAVVRCVQTMDARFEIRGDEGVGVVLNGKDITADIRTEISANAASKIATMPGVRIALLQAQRDFAVEPGLVADGRDMGTVVFPNAWFKIYLTASAEKRAERRYKQLNQKGLKVTMESLLQTIEQRDYRDSTRTVSPLVPAKDALIVDSTGFSINEVVDKLQQAIAAKREKERLA